MKKESRRADLAGLKSGGRLKPALQKFCRFNTVSLAGYGVQLAALWLLIRAGAGYLAATALAVEISVLHNYAWHRLWTWKDRRESSLIRFHLANGAVSMAGNLLLMRLLVGGMALDPIPANVLSNALCGLVNFLLAELWVFPGTVIVNPTVEEPLE